MKRVIRKSVFETNSSSTHSYTIKSVDEVAEDRAFLIKSPLAKLVWFCGICDNAEMVYRASEVFRTEKETREILFDRFVSVYESNEEMRNEVSLKDCSNATSYELDEILYAWDEDYFMFKVDNDIVIGRELVRSIQKELIEEYARRNNASVLGVIKLLFEEGGRVYYTDYVLDGAENEEEEVKRLRDLLVYFGYEYDAAPNKQKVLNRYKMKSGHHCNACSCDCYFEDGALNDCYCGFENYTNIYGEVMALVDELEEGEDVVKKAVEILLSDRVVIEANEEYCGIQPIITDEVY